jgi:drug/metabolite transporter (DMT)-like permease
MSEKLIDMFSGKDGALSLRRIIGTAIIFVGCVLLVIAQFQTGTWEKLLPACVAFVVGAFFWGLVTAQNLIDLKK